ncbi:MAG TPA: IclR family transcriptional regulator, partial [Chloroflexota bacterium]|nr:IclR family transcriptional regulator [Chloroflexota bacterium]
MTARPTHDNPVRGPRPRLVPAVDRAARLLAQLERAGRPMTISELARELGINKGTMRDLLETLRAHGLLERDEERKQYRLGPRLARLGMAALGQLDLARAAHAYLINLAHEIGGAVLLLVRDGDRATIVDKADAGQVAVQVSATVGRRIPLAAGACGKIFLSYVEPGERARHLNQLRATPRTIRDPGAY